LNNGDTGSWIKHKVNGFIYDPDDKNLFVKIAQDIVALLSDTETQNRISMNVFLTEKEKLRTWEERLNEEVNETEKLLNIQSCISGEPSYKISS
jgi:hypothetical protein